MQNEYRCKDNLLILSIENLAGLVNEIFKQHKHLPADEYKLFEERMFGLAVDRIICDHGIIIKYHLEYAVDDIRLDPFINKLHSLIVTTLYDDIMAFLVRLNYSEVAFLRIMVASTKLIS